jgi:hypothetical protein
MSLRGMYARPYPRRGEWAEQQRATPMWADWRRSVYRRDGYTCVLCRVVRRKGLKIEPHHILRKVDRPDLIFDTNNGVTLCHDCHMNKVTGFEQLYVAQFQAYVRNKNQESGSPVQLTGFDSLIRKMARAARTKTAGAGRPPRKKEAAP